MLERFLLRQGGYKVRTFHNPVTAISSLPNDTDIILLGIMMPQMSGLEALGKKIEEVLKK